MKVRLGDVFDLQMGKTPSRNNSDYWGGKNKWASISDLSACDKYISETKECITDKALCECGVKKIPTNTVLVSFKLSIGKVAITARELYTNEAIMAFVDKGIYHFNENYLYYLFSGIDWTKGSNKAVKGLTLNKATLSQKYINLPSLEIQLEIVKRLDKITTLIETRKQQLEKLDLLVKSKFIEMFGNSEYNTKDFPLLKLGDLCTVGSSKRIYQNEQSTKGVPFLRISDLNNRIDEIEDTCELYIPEETYKSFLTGGLIPTEGDILVTARGTLGRCYIVKESDKFYFQDGMITWLSNLSSKVTSLYVSYLFDTDGIKKQIASLQAGSTVAYLSIAMTKKLNIMIPPIKLQNEFASFVEQTDKAKSKIKQSLEKFDILKKALMQKYFG